MNQQPTEPPLSQIYASQNHNRKGQQKLREHNTGPYSHVYSTAPKMYAPKPSDEIYYTKPSRPISPYSEDLSQASTASEFVDVERTKRHQAYDRMEDPDGYWILPHTNSPLSGSISSSTGTSRYVTPGGRYLNRMPKKHTAGTQFVATEHIIPGYPGGKEMLQQNLDELSELQHFANDPATTMTDENQVSLNDCVTFHYNPSGDLQNAFEEDLIIRLQAHCRTYLAKLEKRRRLKEDDAVRCIQRNASLYFDPWVRLFLVLRPHLKRHCLEDEINQLKAELEKFKAMVKVLRYENVAYQDKISRLLQLLDQMHPGSTSGELVNNLVKELSMAVADHQKQWHSMIAGIPTNDLSIVGRLTPRNGGSVNPTDSMTDYQQARDNAEFYRNQLEMVREEVDDQNARTSQHYEEKIGILSERVEHLQNMLTQESFKVDRLNNELEHSHTQLNEAHENEENLDTIIGELKGELSRRQVPFLNSPKEEENMITAKVAEAAYATAPGMSGFPGSNFEPINDKHQETAIALLEGIRNYLEENPAVYEVLKDTPMGNGGDLDILSAKTGKLFSDANNFSYFQDRHINSNSSESLGDFRNTPNQSMNSVYHNQSHVENYNIARQSDIDSRVDALQQKLDDEIGYREDLEMEAQEMRNRITTLTRQIRRQRDEHEEEVVEKDQANLRKIRELDSINEELIKEKDEFERRCAELQKKIEDLRKSPDMSDNEDVADELRDNHAKVVAENRRYQRDLNQLRDEFEQFKLENNTQDLKDQLAEKNEKLSQIEVQNRHVGGDMEIMTVRLQNTNSLLEENEQRLRIATKERQNLMHRILQLETERDSAVREAATSVGRAAAERETASAKARELESIREERDVIRQEMINTKVTLTEASTKALTENVALEKRLADFESAAIKREEDLKSELERYREQIDSLQQDLTELQKQESSTKTDNRHLKRQITDLQDNVDVYCRKVAELERRSSDLLAELDRAKANLSAARETTTLLRDRQTRASEECRMAMSNQDEIQFSDDEDDPYMATSYCDDQMRPTGTDSYSGVQTLDRYQKKNNHRTSARSASRTNPRTLSSKPFSNVAHYGSHRSLIQKSQLPLPDYFTATKRNYPASETAMSDADLDAKNDAITGEPQT